MSRKFQQPARHLGAISAPAVAPAPAAPAAPAVQQQATDTASAAFVAQADAQAAQAGKATTENKLKLATAGTEASNAAADDQKKTDGLKVSVAIAIGIALLKRFL